MGYDIAPLAAPLPSVARVLDACRRAGLMIFYSRQGFREDLSDLTPYEPRRRSLFKERTPPPPRPPPRRLGAKMSFDEFLALSHRRRDAPRRVVGEQLRAGDELCRYWRGQARLGWCPGCGLRRQPVHQRRGKTSRGRGTDEYRCSVQVEFSCNASPSRLPRASSLQHPEGSAEPDVPTSQTYRRRVRGAGISPVPSGARGPGLSAGALATHA